MAANHLLLGIDSSTTSTKAILWDVLGYPVAEGRASIPMLCPQPSWYEQNAHWWWTSTCEAIREAIKQVNPSRIVALSISNQRETFVPVDRNGDPVRNAILWMDQRARHLLPDLEKRLIGERFHRITGKILAGNLTISKLVWLRQNEPDIFQKATHFLDVQAYLIYCLTGLFITSWGSADPTGLFDLRNNQWSAELVAEAGLKTGQLPETAPPGTWLGEVNPQAARATGLPIGLPVIAGLGDGQSAGLGCNITKPGEAYLSLGTSVVSGTFSPEYRTSRYFRTLCGGVPGSFLLESVILGGGYTTDWFIRTFGQVQQASVAQNQPFFTEVEAQAAKIQPGCDGLILVPYWNSVLDPYWDSSASGIMVGWKGGHTLAHFYRAILEGIAFEQRLHNEGVEQSLGARIDRLIAVGGGARDQTWLQIIADVTGKTVLRSTCLETASLGAAILAASGVDMFPDVVTAAQSMTRIDDVSFTPQQEYVERYDRLYSDVFKHLYPSLRKPLTNLSQLTPNRE